MSKAKFSDDFKRGAVHQIVQRGHPVAEVSKRLGVRMHSLYAWMKKFSKPDTSGPDDEQAAETWRLKRELLRITEERDILKKGHRAPRQGCKMKYAFVAEHRPFLDADGRITRHLSS